MSSFNNMNQANNPFWDFVASMQQDPRFAAATAGNPPPPPPPQGERFEPFEGHFPWGPFGPMPHRGKRHEHGGRHGGPRGRSSSPPEHDRDAEGGPSSPPHHAHHDHKGKGPRGGPRPHHGPHPPPPPPPAYGSGDEMDIPPPPPRDAEDPPSRAPTPPSPGSPPPPHEPHHPRGHGPHGFGGPRHHSHGPHGGRGGRFGGRGGRCGGRGGHGQGPFGPHSHHHRGPRGFGGPGGRHHRGPPGGPFPFDLNALAQAFAPGLFGAAYNNDNNNTAVATRGTDNDGMFHPELDLFDTVEAYILHLSLPGAKKPDLSITYSSTRNSVTISGVVARPDVDEEMMDALALDERKVGAFEREVKLEEGVKIDEEGISAKLEDGVLRVVVPKMVQDDDEEYVDVKKISLE